MHSRGWQKLLFQDDDIVKIVKTLVYKLFPLKWGDPDQEFFKEIIQNNNYKEYEKLLEVELFTKQSLCDGAVAMRFGCRVRVTVFKKRQVFIVSLTVSGGQNQSLRTKQRGSESMPVQHWGHGNIVVVPIKAGWRQSLFQRRKY